MNEITIKTPNKITYKLYENNIEVSITYSKNSTLKNKIVMLEKLKEALRII